MKFKHRLIGSIAVVVFIVGISVYAQVNRPYRNGSVWSISFIRIKPGMDPAYMNYLASPWKANQEAALFDSRTSPMWSLHENAHKSDLG